MHASRNIRLCTKDCLCLYVCPTGASDTENGQIDFKKCIGCGRCVKACVSHAIAMIPDTYEYPPQQKHEAGVVSSVKKLAASKAEQEQIARKAMSAAADPVEKQFAEALMKSNRKMAEDLYREAGYMLPQSRNAHDFLKFLLDREPDEEFPKEAVQELLKLLPVND
jgi:Fe-S-cluster-containing hydrogenase component 2